MWKLLLDYANLWETLAGEYRWDLDSLLENSVFNRKMFVLEYWEIFHPLIHNLYYVRHWGAYEEGRPIEQQPISLFNAAALVIKDKFLSVAKFPKLGPGFPTPGQYALTHMDEHKAEFSKMTGGKNQALFERFMAATKFMRIGPRYRTSAEIKN